MAKVGFSPPTRVFEAAGAAACLVTDYWTGVEQFFEPGKEILVAKDANDVVAYLQNVTAEQAHSIGLAMRERAMREHTYELRAKEVERHTQSVSTTRAFIDANRLRNRDFTGAGVKIIICGLSITSSWGNGHATTYRALVSALKTRGHQVVFFERDLEWYASNRDMPEPPFCRVHIYETWGDVTQSAASRIVGRRRRRYWVPTFLTESSCCRDSGFGHSRQGLLRYRYAHNSREIESWRRRVSPRDHVPGFDLYFSFTGGPLLKELESKFGAKRAIPLYCSFDSSRYRLDASPTPGSDVISATWELMLLIVKANSMRCFARQRPSSTEGKFIVAGPQYPAHIKWPENVKRIVHWSRSSILRSIVLQGLHSI